VTAWEKKKRVFQLENRKRNRPPGTFIEDPPQKRKEKQKSRLTEQGKKRMHAELKTIERR